MQLITPIEISKSKFKIEPGHKIMFLGSCFADSIGEKFVQGGFDALVNPFGTLYNPMSISNLLLRCVEEKEYDASSEEVFMSEDGLWHSWMHHTKFSAHSEQEIVDNINNKMHETAAFLRSADVLIITLGTSIIYRLKENGMLVANCHKQLDSMFIRERLSVDKIVDNMLTTLQRLQVINSKLRVIITVSPIRHKRDGLHVNNISKGILLQAVDELINSVDNLINTNNNSSLMTPDSSLITYFPSYEIMLDELRDYRFYAEDMIHPSPLAVNYIWQRFQDTYFDHKTQEYVKLKNKEWARSQHVNKFVSL